MRLELGSPFAVLMTLLSSLGKIINYHGWDSRQRKGSTLKWPRIIKQDILRYCRNEKNKCLGVSTDCENYFNATVLEKVDTECRRGEGYPAEDEFYPTLHRPPNFYDRSDEMTKQAFCELWGPLTNIFDHGVGEVGISLHDLKRVGGLSTLGAMYEEFLPLNKDLAEHNKYPAAAVELLRIPTKLCKFYKVGHIYYDLWLDHFYREYLEYFAYEEHTYSEKGKVETKKRSPLCISRQKRMTDLNVIVECELAAFLAFCLSRPVLPHDKEVIRPEIFAMDTLMAFGAWLYLSRLRRGQQVIETILVKLIQFLPIYDSLDSDCRSHFPTLVRFAGWLGRKLSLPQARHVFRDGRYLSLRASSYNEDSRNGRDVIDIGLPDEDFKFHLPIWLFYFLYVLELNYFWSPITPTDLLTNLDSIKGFY
ncbi:hypothetical protein Cgig2_024538 [Carnegiea gigantea]|uniref:Uncharacterized protein n=1 Tax=Carnegiea gigantea TaxID=171969 RepID=A0A9Q1JXU0_9CARY|nr:hypothetical protein Cgig2_024538 [Carnegiea gigantea]